MKKILAAALAAFIGLSAYAGNVSVGGKVLGSYNLNAIGEDGAKFGFGIAAHANFGLYQTEKFEIGLQPELRLIFNQGYKDSYSYSTYDYNEYYEEEEDKYTSLDFPLLATFTFNVNEKISLGLGVGPFAAISLFHTVVSYNDYEEFTWNAGLATELMFGIKAGPGKITADLGFTKAFAHSDGDFGLSYRSADLTFAAGYQYRF